MIRNDSIIRRQCYSIPKNNIFESATFSYKTQKYLLKRKHPTWDVLLRHAMQHSLPLKSLDKTENVQMCSPFSQFSLYDFGCNSWCHTHIIHKVKAKTWKDGVLLVIFSRSCHLLSSRWNWWKFGFSRKKKLFSFISLYSAAICNIFEWI